MVRLPPGLRHQRSKRLRSLCSGRRRSAYPGGASIASVRAASAATTRALQRLRRRLRRLRPPQGLDQLVRTDHLAPAQQQQREQRPLLRARPASGRARPRRPRRALGLEHPPRAECDTDALGLRWAAWASARHLRVTSRYPRGARLPRWIRDDSSAAISRESHLPRIRRAEPAMPRGGAAGGGGARRRGLRVRHVTHELPSRRRGLPPLRGALGDAVSEAMRRAALAVDRIVETVGESRFERRRVNERA